MAKHVTSDDGPRRAVLCKTCPFRRTPITWPTTRFY